MRYAKSLLQDLFLIATLCFGLYCDSRSNLDWKDTSGTYRLILNHGNPNLRNRGEKYLDLIINQKETSLSLIETSRGLNNFCLKIQISKNNNLITIHYDSIIFNGLFSPPTISRLKIGEQLLSLEKNPNGFSGSSAELKILFPDINCSPELNFERI